jgi:hypothetical protein
LAAAHQEVVGEGVPELVWPNVIDPGYSGADINSVPGTIG